MNQDYRQLMEIATIFGNAPGQQRESTRNMRNILEFLESSHDSRTPVTGNARDPREIPLHASSNTHRGVADHRQGAFGGRFGFVNNNRMGSHETRGVADGRGRAPWRGRGGPRGRGYRGNPQVHLGQEIREAEPVAHAEHGRHVQEWIDRVSIPDELVRPPDYARSLSFLSNSKPTSSPSAERLIEMMRNVENPDFVELIPIIHLLKEDHILELMEVLSNKQTELSAVPRPPSQHAVDPTVASESCNARAQWLFALMAGHLVEVELKDGTRYEGVFIQYFPSREAFKLMSARLLGSSLHNPLVTSSKIRTSLKCYLCDLSHMLIKDVCTSSGDPESCIIPDAPTPGRPQ